MKLVKNISGVFRNWEMLAWMMLAFSLRPVPEYSLRVPEYSLRDLLAWLAMFLYFSTKKRFLKRY